MLLFVTQAINTNYTRFNPSLLTSLIPSGLLYALGNFDDIEGDIKGVNAVMDGINPAQAFFLELFGTMFLILTILSTINEQHGHAASYLQPLSIGIAILVMHIFLVSTLESSFTPIYCHICNFFSVSPKLFGKKFTIPFGFNCTIQTNYLEPRYIAVLIDRAI